MWGSSSQMKDFFLIYLQNISVILCHLWYFIMQRRSKVRPAVMLPVTDLHNLFPCTGLFCTELHKWPALPLSSCNSYWNKRPSEASAHWYHTDAILTANVLVVEKAKRYLLEKAMIVLNWCRNVAYVRYRWQRNMGTNAIVFFYLFLNILHYCVTMAMFRRGVVFFLPLQI